MRVAIVGATGAVGQELMKLLYERSFPLTSLELYASARSEGKEIVFDNHTLKTKTLPEDGNLNADVVFHQLAQGSHETTLGIGVTTEQ